MIDINAIKVEMPLGPDNNTSTSRRSHPVDSSDCDQILYLFSLGTLSNDLVQMGVRGSDDFAGPFTATIEGDAIDKAFGAFGGSGAPSLPTGTDDQKLYGIFVNCGINKRYHEVWIQTGASNNYTSCHAIKGRLKKAPDTAAERGLEAEIAAND